MSGTAITRRDGKLVVPDQPVIPFIEGDGTGPDIWRASVRVFDAAVAKAYGGKRTIVWREVLAGEKSFNQTGNWLPEETLAAFREYLVGHQGPAHDAGWRWHSIAQRRVEAGTRPVRLSASRPVFRGHGDAGEASRPRRHGDLPREHRGHLRRHRVPRRHPRGRGVQEGLQPGVPEALQEDPLPRHDRYWHQADLARGQRALDPRRVRVRHREQAEEPHPGPQGQHHEVHRGRVPRLGLRAGETRVRRGRVRRRAVVQAARTA